MENEGEKQKVDVNIWDMAGQGIMALPFIKFVFISFFLEVYYTTHQFFLSEATIYVVVWNVMPGNK